MRRTFAGDSQSTTQLNDTPLPRRPVTSTRSSCSRPERCCVSADRRSTGAPPSQRTRSRSWVARSLTTPTSRIAVAGTADALGGDEEDVAELAVHRAAAQLEQRGVAALDVADGAADARGRDGVDDRPRLGGGGGQRLLDEHVDPGAHEPRDGSEVLRSVGTATTAKSGVPGGQQRRRCRVQRRPDRGPRRTDRRRDRPRRRTRGPGGPGGCARGAGRSSPGPAPRRAGTVSHDRRSRRD